MANWFAKTVGLAELRRLIGEEPCCTPPERMYFISCCVGTQIVRVFVNQPLNRCMVSIRQRRNQKQGPGSGEWPK